MPDTGVLVRFETHFLDIDDVATFRSVVRFVVVRPRQGHHGLVGKRQRGVVHLWPRRRLAIFAETRHGPDLSGTSGE